MFYSINLSDGILCSKISMSDSERPALIGEFTLKTKYPHPVGSAGILPIQTQGSLLFELSFDAQIWRKIERKLAVSDGWVNRFLIVWRKKVIPCAGLGTETVFLNNSLSLNFLVRQVHFSITIFPRRNPDLSIGQLKNGL